VVVCVGGSMISSNQKFFFEVLINFLEARFVLSGGVRGVWGLTNLGADISIASVEVIFPEFDFLMGIWASRIQIS
jgi:hypothetical protein